MSELLNYETLAKQLNTKFVLIDSAEPFELELIEVTEPTVTISQTYFSLYFLGDINYLLPQGTYRMNHSELGETLFFLVPTARDADGCKYESVFNLLNQPTWKVKISLIWPIGKLTPIFTTTYRRLITACSIENLSLLPGTRNKSNCPKSECQSR